MKVKWQSDAPNMELKVPSEVKIDGYIPTAEDLTFTGSQTKGLFQYGRFSWVLQNYTPSFSNIENAVECFAFFKSNVNLTNLTFYMSKGNNNNIQSMFYGNNLSSFPHIVGKVKNCSSFFYGSTKMKSIPDNFFDDFIFQESNTTVICGQIFYDCEELTKVPSLKAFKQLNSTPTPGQYYNFYNNLFYNCLNLQEIRNLPIVYGINSEVRNNFFNDTFYYTYKLSSFTFEPNQTARLSGQGLDFTRTGYKYYGVHPKESVYNHDSAVETINSLPDTSAYLAEVGGTNTIKFYSYQGGNTEGGAIGNLTAEEIAVAAAKGWTVALK